MGHSQTPNSALGVVAEKEVPQLDAATRRLAASLIHGLVQGSVLALVVVLSNVAAWPLEKIGRSMALKLAVVQFALAFIPMAALMLAAGLTVSLIGGRTLFSLQRHLLVRLIAVALPSDRQALAYALAVVTTVSASFAALFTCAYLSHAFVLQNMSNPKLSAAVVGTTVGLAGAIVAWKFSPFFRALHRRLQRVQLGFLPTSVVPLTVLVLLLTVAGTILKLSDFPFESFFDVLRVYQLDGVSIGVPSVLLAGALLDSGRLSRVWKSLAVSVCVVVAVITMGLSMRFVSDNDTRFLLHTLQGGRNFHLRIVSALSDNDGDGQAPLLEGDCDDANAYRFAGAREVPSNAIDEDCDGADLEPADVVARGSSGFVGDTRFARPNLVLITIDALSYNRTSLANPERRTTPGLAELAKSGVVFSRAYASGPRTANALPSLFAGKYNPQLRQRPRPGSDTNEIRSGNQLLAERLSAVGYRTAAVIPTPLFRDWRGLTQGFHDVFDEPARQWRDLGYRNDHLVSQAAAEAAQRPGAPVFLWVHYFGPHMPYVPSGGATEPGPLPGDARDAPFHDAEVIETDAELSRLVKKLTMTLGERDTLFFVTADHGESFDALHQVKHHGEDMHSSVLHVPLVIHGRGLARRVCDSLVSSLDLAPTLLDLAGIDDPGQLEGRSLVRDVLTGCDPTPRVLFHFYDQRREELGGRYSLKQIGVRDDNRFLIHDVQSGSLGLFDYPADPQELVNLASAEPGNAARLRRLGAGLLARLGVSNEARSPAAGYAQ